MLSLRVVLIVGLVLVVRGEREAGRSREEWTTVLDLSARQHAEKLRIYAADGPNVNGLSVILLQQDELRSSVPPRNHMPCQVSLQALLGRRRNRVALARSARQRL